MTSLPARRILKALRNYGDILPKPVVRSQRHVLEVLT